MKRTLILSMLAIFTMFFLCNCEDNVSLNDSYFMQDGVIVGNVPSIWTTPFDTVNNIGASSSVGFTRIQLGSKAVTGSYQNGYGGLRCIDMETGEVLWNKSILPCILFMEVIDFNAEDEYFIIRAGNSLFGFGSIHMKIDINTGESLWEQTIDSYSHSYAVNHHHYYVTKKDGFVETAQPSYRVDIETGDVSLFYVGDLEPNYEEYDYTRTIGVPFIYNGKEFAFILEGRPDLDMQLSGDWFYSLMDVETGELLFKHRPNIYPDNIAKVEVYNDKIYVITSLGYKIFDMNTLSFSTEVTLHECATFRAHQFYNDKLFLSYEIKGGLGFEAYDAKPFYAIDLNTNTKVHELEKVNAAAWSILDNTIYFTINNFVLSYNIETWKQQLQLRPGGNGINLTFDINTYQNGNGERFLVCSNSKLTFCYPAL